MPWLTPVDFYCERVAPGLWAEPFNMITGVAFLVVGIWVLHQGRGGVRIIAAALALVGLASALFHGFGTYWGLWADLIANQIFNAALIWGIARAFWGLSQARAITAGLIGAFAMYHAGGMLASVAPQLAPAGGYLLLLALLLVSRWQKPTPLLLPAALLLAAGLPFRLADMHLCAVWPYGTHMIWHLFNATAMACLLWSLSRGTVAEPIKAKR